MEPLSQNNSEEKLNQPLHDEEKAAIYDFLKVQKNEFETLLRKNPPGIFQLAKQVRFKVMCMLSKAKTAGLPEVFIRYLEDKVHESQSSSNELQAKRRNTDEGKKLLNEVRNIIRKERNPSLNNDHIPNIQIEKDIKEQYACAMMDDIKEISEQLLEKRLHSSPLNIISLDVSDIKHAELRSMLDKVQESLNEKIPGSHLFPVKNCAYKGGVARYGVKLLASLIKSRLLQQEEKEQLQHKLEEQEITYASLSEQEHEILQSPDFHPEFLGPFAKFADMFREFDETYLTAEADLSDVDVVIGKIAEKEKEKMKEIINGPVSIYKVAELMGAASDGTEKMPEFDFDDVSFLPEDYLDSRDVHFNEIFLGSSRLILTEEALVSILKSNITSRGNAVNIYGRDRVYINGLEYISSRTGHRFVKYTKDGKSKNFTLPRYNLELDLGAYWLVLARNSFEKKNAPEHIARLYLIAKQMGQHGGTENPVEFLNYLVRQHPYFSFNKNQSPEEVATWLMGRYVRMFHSHLKQYFHIKNPESSMKSTDLTPVTISVSFEEARALSKEFGNEIQTIITVLVKGT